MPKSVVPSVKLKSFNCPHCGALADQAWYEAYANPVNGELPDVIDAARLQGARQRIAQLGEEAPAEILERFERESTGEMFLLNMNNWKSCRFEVVNIYLSICFSCNCCCFMVTRNVR